MNMLIPAYATSPQSRPLSAQETVEFGRRVDEIRETVMKNLGKEDADYIYKVRNFVRVTEVISRAMLMFGGWLPPVWVAATGMLGISKIVENMELGHNVIHGQYDWLNDPSLNGATYEWDTVCTSEDWKYTHNYMHHTYTNVLGRDHDIGYGFMRMTREQKWEPRFLFNIPLALILSTGFQWLLSMQRFELEKVLHGDKKIKEVFAQSGPWRKKALRQFVKDYVFFPVLAGPMFLSVLAGNAVANLMRNYWSSFVIYCGHFTGNAQMLEDNVDKETRADWYLRQIKGSGNFTGGRLIHFLSGNLSHQIEHHLFPTMPANRYKDVAPQIQALCAEYGQHYNKASFARQIASVFWRLTVHSLPNHTVDKLALATQRIRRVFSRPARAV